MTQLPALQASKSSNKWKPLKRRLLAYSLLLGGFWIGAGAGLAWLTVQPKPAHPSITPKSFKMAYRTVSFKSSDGIRLVGWLIPAENGPSKGVIILCHGVDGTREGMLEYALQLHKHGYATLLYDSRARGESGGDRCTMGYREVDDLLAAVKFVQGHKELANAKIGVYGHSLGGAVAIMGAARSQSIVAVAAESPFACLDHALSNHFHKGLGFGGALMVPPVTWAGQMMIGRNVCDIAPVTEVKRISPRPLLLIQDADDRLCPPEETRALLKAAGEPKELWTVPGADHIQAIEAEPKEFERRLTEFFDRAFLQTHKYL